MQTSKVNRGQQDKEKTAVFNKNSFYKMLGVSGTLMGLLLTSQATLAQDDTKYSQAHQITLPAAKLTDSLVALGEQFAVNLVFSADQMANQQSIKLKGNYTLPQALQQLLDGSGFVAERQNDSFVIKKLPETTEYDERDTVLIIGRAGLDQVNKTATKMDLSIRDTGRSIAVLDDRALREMAATSVEQTLDYMPGFSTNDSNYGSLMARGLVTDYNNVLIDGLRTLQGANDGDGGRTGSVLPSTYNLESVAFLRGQDGLLYGSGIGGGMINLTTKKPQEESATSIGIQGKSYLSDDTGYAKRNSVSFNLDSTGAINEDILYRVITQLTPSGESFQKGLEVDEKLADLSLTFKVGDNTRITPRIEFAERKYKGAASVRSVFENGYFSPGAKYGTPTQRSHHYGSDQDFNNNKTINADVTVEHDFNEDWSVSSRFRYSETDAEQRSLELSIPYSNPVAGAATQKRRWRGYQNNDTYRMLDLGLQGKFKTGDISHHLLAGASYRDFSTRYGGGYQSSSSTETNSIDVNNPDNQVVGPVPDNVKNFDITPKEVRDLNLYVKDRIKVGKLTVSPGISFVKQEQVRSRSSQLNFTNVYKDDHSKVVWDLGLMYPLSDNFNAFATYSYAYDPINVRYIGQYGYEFNNLGKDNYVPIEGNNYEIGIKGDLLDEKVTLSLTAFKLDRENKTNFDCSRKVAKNGCLLVQTKGPNFSSKGVEADLTFKPTSQWSGSLNYAFTRAAFTKGDNKGVQADNTPKHSLALWNRYRLSGDLSDYKLGLGLRYESERTFSGNKVPSYVEADLGVYYDNNEWEASLLLKNALDKNRASTGSRNFLVVPNEPRTLNFSIKRHF